VISIIAPALSSPLGSGDALTGRNPGIWAAEHSDLDPSESDKTFY